MVKILEFVIYISELYSIIVTWGGLTIINISFSCLGFLENKWYTKYRLCKKNCYKCLNLRHVLLYLLLLFQFDLKKDDTGCSFTCHKSCYFRRCPWCNCYRCRMWTRRHEFKSWTSLIIFHIALIPLGKVWIQIFSLQLWVNSRAD